MKNNKIKRRTAIKGALAGIASLSLANAFPNALSAASNISYWHHFTSESEFDGMQQVIQYFQSLNPGTTINEDTIPNKDYMVKVTGANLTNSLPHTGMMATQRYGDLHRLKVVKPITDLINDWYLVKNGSIERAVFDDVTDSNGDIYGAPAFAFIPWMYYRKDWFDEAGLKAPKTWDEFVHAAKTLTDPAKGRYGFGMRGGGGGQGFLQNTLERFGGFEFDKKSASFDREKTIEGLQAYADLHLKHKVTPPSAPTDSYRQLMEAFRTGQTAMLWHHTGSYKELTAVLKEGVEIATAPMPRGSVKEVAHVGYLFNAIFNEAEREASWKWISTWMENEAAVAFLKKTGYLAPSKAIENHPDVKNNPNYLTALNTLAIGTPRANFPGLDGWQRTVLMKEFQKVLVKQTTVTKAVDTIIKAFDKSVKTEQ